MNAAARVEWAKAVRSLVVRSATALVVVGILALSVAMTLAADSGNPQVAAKLGPLAEEEGWALLVGVVSMISAPACLLGYGAVLSWIVGREFVDGTISGLFGLPVSRRSIATAKLVVFGGWTAVVATALVVGCVVAGLSLGYGVPAGPDASALARLLGVGLMTGLLAVPTAWVATLGRGVLPGIALSVVLIALAQIFVVAGSGAWFPVAAPSLWVVSPEDVSWAQLGLVPVAAGAFVLLTTRAWDRLELDR